MVSNRGSLWALQRFNSKHAVLCGISHAPDLHGRLATSGVVVVIGVHTSCFLLVSCFCSYTTWTDSTCSFLFDVDTGLMIRIILPHLARYTCLQKKKKKKEEASCSVSNAVVNKWRLIWYYLSSYILFLWYQCDWISHVCKKLCGLDWTLPHTLTPQAGEPNTTTPHTSRQFWCIYCHLCVCGHQLLVWPLLIKSKWNSYY